MVLSKTVIEFELNYDLSLKYRVPYYPTLYRIKLEFLIIVNE